VNIIYINNKTMTILIHKFGNCKYETHKMMMSDHRTMNKVEKEEYGNIHPHLKGEEGQDGGNIHRARELRKRLTNAEKKLWSHIRLRQITGHKFRRQQLIGRYIVDFACLEKKLVVEVDGGQHSLQSSSDKERTVWLESQGYRVLRFWNDEVLKEIEIILDVIARALEEDDYQKSEIDSNGRDDLMGRIEHITTQQIIGEWGSINKFASSHGVSPASTKMVIYVDGAKSRPVEEALRKYGYLNLLHFEKELRKRGQTFSDYLAEGGLNPVELIETLRMKEIHPEVLLGLKRRGYWGVLETEGGSEEVSKGLVRKRSKKEN
jgi:very-short-patch-repair endonuclease